MSGTISWSPRTSGWNLDAAQCIRPQSCDPDNNPSFGTNPNPRIPRAMNYLDFPGPIPWTFQEAPCAPNRSGRRGQPK
eukprot:5805030-Pyramimonas_sp.AAC.1